MDDPVTLFVIVAIIAMVLMSMITRSIGGAFLGLAIVCFFCGVYLIQSGGAAFVLGAVLIFGGFLCAMLTFGLGLNFSHSQMTKYESDGTKWQATQTVLGDGAKSATSNWSAYPHSSGRSLPSGDYKRIGSGD